MSDFDFIDYDKISNKSDAFIASDELNSYFQYIPSTKATSYNIKKELHTAGTTEDPEDYKVPDVSNKILPRKLYRINPFHSNYSENLELNKVNTDPDIIFPTKIKEFREKKIDYSSLGLNEDQIEFMMALQNLKSLKLDDSFKELDIEQFKAVDEKVANGFFQLYPRYMEMLATGYSSGALGQLFDESESTSSVDENQSLINDSLKKLGLNPNDVRVKKKFEVRAGNAKKDEVNAYLQDISLSNNTSTNTKSINNNSVTNINQLNLQNNNKIELQVRSSKTVNNISSANNTDFNFINNTNKTVNQQVTNVSKFSEATKIDFENLYKAFLKDLNIAPKVENQFYKIVNQHSKNLSIEFNRILNHSEKTVYETNLKNLSTSYNFYRHIENRYREFIQNLNFFNETVQQIKQTEVNLKNTYQNIHRHSVTHKNNHYKNIVNLTKNVNYEYTANDYEFQYAVLKTIKNSNQYVENKITKIKNDLNVAQQNISFVHHRMVHIQEKTSNFVAKEIKNVLNNTDYIDDYSNIIVNKISNISNNQTVRALLSLVSNEEQLNSIYTVLRQSNINTSNIKNLVDVLNYSKNNNLEITKVSRSTVENIKNLVSLSNNVVDFNNTENKIITNIDENIIQKLSSTNITQELKSFVNLSESKSFTRIAKSINNVNHQDIKNLLSLSSDVKNLYSLSKFSNIDSTNIENLYKLINYSKNNNFDITRISGSTIENIKNLVSLSNNQFLSKIDQNIINKFSSSNFSEELKSFVNLSESKSFTRIAQSYKNISNIVENLNTTSINPKLSTFYVDQKNVDNLNILKNVNNIQQIKELSQVVNKANTTYVLEKLSNFNTENVIEKINLLKNINITQDVKKTENIVRKITRLARYKNVNQLTENVEEITNLENNISTTQFKTEIQNLKNLINLTKNVDQVNVDTINNIDISKLNNIKVSQFNLLLDNINQLTKINQVSNLTEQHIEIVRQISQLQNVNQNTVEAINQIQNVNQNTVQKISQVKNVDQNTIRAINQIQNIGQENIYRISQIKNVDQNTIQAINQIQNATDQKINLINSVKVNDIQNITKMINLTSKNDMSNFKLSSINQLTEVVQKISNIENKDLLNVVNLTKTIQERKIYNRISNLVKNVEVLDTVNVTQETAQNISKISNTNNINQITKDLNLISQNYREFKTSVQQINKISQVRNVDQIVKNLNFVNNVIQENNVVNRVSKIDQKEFITAINLSKNYIQSFNRFESKISNISQRQKIRETLQDINITNNVQNNSVMQVTNKTQKVQLQEFIQNLNLLETEKNTTILNRYSFESNKKNISNLVTELNLTQQNKQEKKSDREFARISKRLDKMNRETIKVEGNSYKVEQNFFDMMSFYNEQKITKTSKNRKVNNFFQLLDVLNVQKTTNERKVTQKIHKIEQTQNRIINNTSQIKIDVYKEKKDNFYKVDNRQTFTTNNYHQEKEEQKKTEKIVENKVEELLVKKIENVTNNLVSNVFTKNEFQTIKKEIIQEIYNIEMKTEEKIREIRKETQQTVQTMLERFLRS
jgi:hypothetical protein